MSIDFSGRVAFANDIAAEEVSVRVFVKGQPGKADEDLTATPGRSDASGHFTVSFDPSRHLDTITIGLLVNHVPILNRGPANREGGTGPADVLPVYFQFTYTFDGQPCIHKAPLELFQNEFRLPETVPLQFTPSLQGFHFVNSFQGYPLPFSVPDLPFLPKVSQPYGLCGGMSSAAYDFFLFRRPIPPRQTAPSQRTNLYRYLYRRSIDTFGHLGASIVQVAQWMALPDETVYGTQKRTFDEFKQVRKSLDAQRAVVLALIYTRVGPTFDIWNNHQVLAAGYTPGPNGELDIRLYDCNYPGRDDVVIHAEPVEVGKVLDPHTGKQTILGLKCVQKIGGDEQKQVRGFFVMPYVLMEPPSGL